VPAAAVTHRELVADLRALGVRDGGVVMVHTRMSALGWVIGGSETVVRALLETVGPDGTLLAYASWQDHVYDADAWPAEYRAAYVADPPVFDPRTGEAAHDHGRIPERIRTWPGALRSKHPEASVVAVGAHVRHFTVDHSRHDDAYGSESPFARFVAADGQVLMLGAPLESITVLHHAEALADVPGRLRRAYTVPVREGDRVVEYTYTDYDTSGAVLPYADLKLDADEFEVIARDALAAGIGTTGRVGAADCHLFDAAALVDFAVTWIEGRFS
jgi:aminoglycoside 3-N-acetyltransferase